MENKQTAVEWLEDELSKRYTSVNFNKLFMKAKAMEKEQIIKAFEINYDYPNGIAASEQYYKRKYGK